MKKIKHKILQNNDFWIFSFSREIFDYTVCSAAEQST